MTNYTYLREKKASSLKKFYDASFEEKDVLSIHSYNDATILPLRRFPNDSILFGRGGVVSNENEYISESAIPNRVQGYYEHTIKKKINKKVVYCGYFVNQWGHFLIEAVARLWYFLEKDDSIDHYVFFVNENEKRIISGNFKVFFELLGILDKIVLINEPTQYREVIIPELSYNRSNYFSNQYKRIFNYIAEKAINPEVEAKFSKIFFSRSKISRINQKEFGLEMLDDFFERNGYKVLHPEQLNLKDLINFIQNADEIATMSGSVHHNLLFAQDNKKIIIIERNVLNNEIQVDINRIKNFNTTYIDANIPIYPIDLGLGPFIIANNNLLQAFTENNGYRSVSKKYSSDNYLKHLFKLYMKCYRKFYAYNWYMEHWMLNSYDYIREGYEAGFQYYGKFLIGKKPFLLKHYFDIQYLRRNAIDFILSNQHKKFIKMISKILWNL